MAVFGLPGWVVGLIVLLVILVVLFLIVSALGEDSIELVAELID